MNYDYNSQGGQQPPISFGMAPQQSGNGKGYATASLILGIAGIFFACCCFCLYYAAIVFGILSIVMAFLAKSKNGGKMPGKAVAGLVLGIIAIIFFICFIALGALLNSGAFDAALNEFFYEATGMTMEEYMEFYMNELESVPLPE